MKEEKAALALIAARDVTSARTGRIAVLETAVRALKEAGHPVIIIAITNHKGPSSWLGSPVFRVPTPPFYSMPGSALRSLVRGKTLNESLFDSAKVRHQVLDICISMGVRAVIADNIRTWDAAQATGLPVLMHLDDLLSSRYSSPEFRKANDSVFGYFSDQIPLGVRPALEELVKHLLGLEAKLAYRREIEISQQAAATALTSASEADLLAGRAKTSVWGLPMAVAQQTPSTPSANPAHKVVFLGYMHYGPNMGALRYLRDEVLPILQERGRKVEITVIGQADEEQKAEFAQHPISFKGYVEDLYRELAQHRLFVSPVQSGTGVKTKVLDALSVGIPVVATPLGIEGIPATHGHEYLVGHTPLEFAQHIEYLMDNPEGADAIGAAGYELLGRSMNPQKVYQDWAQAVEEALEGERSYAHSAH